VAVARATGAGPRSFSFRAGIRLSGTTLTCDARSSASDLIVLSHAQALGALGPRRFPLRPAARQDLLATEPTLALLGLAGERLKRHALPAVFGRPFTLGSFRVELFPSGHLPGSSSVLVEGDGRRLLYAGTVRRGRPGFGSTPGEVRRADAVCLDATFGDPRFVLPPPEEALADVRRFVEETLVAKRAPVLLTPPFSTAMEVAVSLVAAGFAPRAHRSIVAAAAAHRRAGAAAPRLPRFAGRLGPREVLLWPPERRDAPLLGALADPRFAYVSGFSLDPRMREAMRADAAMGLSNQSGFPELISYLEQVGAEEVAVHRGFAEGFAAELRARGYLAYALGPPQQMELFRG
jgi:hypothetical protein